MAVKIQLARGTDEQVDDVRVTRNKDGSISVATFSFFEPNCMVQGEAQGFQEITGLFLIDDEGEITCRNVSAKYANGSLVRVEAVHKMEGAAEWERFLRFMERYAESNGMDFNRA
jgi:photosystem II protein